MLLFALRFTYVAIDESYMPGTGFSVFQFLLCLERDFGPFFLFQPRAGKKMEHDFERIHGLKSKISQILFLFGEIPVYARTGLKYEFTYRRGV